MDGLTIHIMCSQAHTVIHILIARVDNAMNKTSHIYYTTIDPKTLTCIMPTETSLAGVFRYASVLVSCQVRLEKRLFFCGIVTTMLAVLLFT